MALSSGAVPKNKKKGRYVSSRYLQAAEKVSLQSHSSEEKSVFLRSSKENLGLHSIGNSYCDLSKPNASQSTQGITSTPMFDRQFLCPSLDESAVASTQNHKNSKEGMGSHTADSFKSNLSKLHFDKSKKNKQLNMKNMEEEIDLLYCSYLQAAFLESEAKKALKARSAIFQDDICKLIDLFMRKLNKLKKQDCVLKILSNINKICFLCQKQEEILKPIFESIPNLEEKYRSLEEAVTATKHKLSVKDVVLPEPGCERELHEELMKMCSSMEAFFTIIPNYEDVISSCGVLKDYVDVTESLNDELKRTLNLLLKARTMQVSETFLSTGALD